MDDGEWGPAVDDLESGERYGIALEDAQKSRNTLYLQYIVEGKSDAQTLDELFVATQRELSAMASYLMSSERENHTLQPTALVNEAYLRLFEADKLTVESKTHFVNIAARAMRQVLVEHARRRNAAKRGGGWKAIRLTDIGVQDFQDQVDVIDLHDALETLAGLDQRAAEVVELRVFGGLKMEQIAGMMNLTRRTIQKDWRFATMWLRREFSRGTAV